jgi:hypothetical protein
MFLTLDRVSSLESLRNKSIILLAIMSFLIYGYAFFLEYTYDPVGVEEGDWAEYVIEYNRTIAGQEPIWFRFKVISIQETNMTYVLSRKLSDGSINNETAIIDLAKDLKAITFFPASMNIGDHYVLFGEQRSVEGTKVRAYSNKNRIILFSDFGDSTLFWDKKTGVFVEFHQKWNDRYYKISKTNIWD